MIDWTLTIACIVLSTLTTYMFWCWFRVWYFRQRLFMIRDELWDRMYAKGKLNDPEYIAFREAINAMIRTAHIFSLSTCLYLALIRDQDQERTIKVPIDDDVRLAREKAVTLAVRYLMLESVSGILLTSFLLLSGIWLLSFAKAINIVGRILDSRKLISLKLRDQEVSSDPAMLAHLH